MVTNSLLLVVPGISAQAQHVVVGKTRTAKRLSQDLFLLGRRVKAKTICAFDFHALHDTQNACKKQEQEPQPTGCPLSLPMPKGRGISRRIR